MKGTGSEYLTYGLFQDVAYATSWGNTAGTGKVISEAILAQLITVYGKIDPGQNVSTGIYTYSVVLTITF